MRILFFCDCSGNLGNATRILKTYEFVCKLHKDVIFCNLHNWHNSSLKLISNLSFVTSVLKNINKMDLAYIKNEAYMSLGLYVLDRVLRRKRPDIIFAEETRLAYMATLNQHNIPVISDLHAVISAEYSECPDLRKSDRHLSRIKEIEKEVCEKTSDILVVSNNMKEYLSRTHKIKENKVTVVQNGADLYYKYARYRRRTRLIYGGMFSFWEDLDTYLDMAKKDSKHEYYLIGTGPLQSHILNRIQKENIKVNYLGYKDKTGALDLFCEMGAGVAPSTRNVTRYVASPVKVYDYMACGLPVITPNYGEWAKHIQENDCGFVTKNSSAEEFLEAAYEMKDREIWEQKSKNAVEAIKTKFSWDSVLAPIRDVLSRY